MSHTLTLREALSVFEENLPDIRKACLDNSAESIKKYSPYKELDIDEPKITTEAIWEHINHLRIENEVKPLFQTIRRIDSYREHKDKPQTAGFITDDDIQRARESTSDWFIYQASLSTRKPHKGMCPFHNDTSPSLTLMQSKQTGHLYLKCFVCNDAWDSIGFIQARDNVDFIEAVKIIIS